MEIDCGGFEFRLERQSPMDRAGVALASLSDSDDGACDSFERVCGQCNGMDVEQLFGYGDGSFLEEMLEEVMDDMCHVMIRHVS